MEMIEDKDPTTLDEKRRSQLDKNIRQMIDGGASNDDVAKYAQDFRTQFGAKKKSGHYNRLKQWFRNIYSWLKTFPKY